jgi:glutamate--cysteine ligase
MAMNAKALAPSSRFKPLSTVQDRLRALSPAVLRGIRRGIEKESLRVRPDGSLAGTPHMDGLGSALTHPNITTDFSEAQLELITGTHNDVDAVLVELTEIHQAVYRHLGDELLWCSSMPCSLPARDEDIPIGRYGTSNVGRAKTVYRNGLAHRYGRRMQTISGIHYNFSLPEDITWTALPQLRDANRGYFSLIRNFRRHSWLPIYLFGASPAACGSFVADREHDLEKLSADTLYLPHATSLRMGRLGYQSDAQASLHVSYNSLASYGASLYDALIHPYEPYERIGIRDERGEYRQLSTSLLQIENEFYSPIRAKRRIHPGERPLHALRERGVEYVEVRLMDLDPFSPIGIRAHTCRFLDVLLLHCLLSDSPPDSPDELAAVARNKQLVASRGRDPQLKLTRGNQQVPLVDWAGELLVECESIARAMDGALGGGAHVEALASAAAALGAPDTMPSARMLHAMARNHGNSFVRFALTESMLHKAALMAVPFDEATQERYADLARASLAKQRQIEAADRMPFEEYRQKYLAPELLRIED